MIRYHDFQIRIESKCDGGFEVKAQCPKGDSTTVMRLPNDIDARSELLAHAAFSIRHHQVTPVAARGVRFGKDSSVSPRKFGGDLFKALFSGGIGTKFYECYGDLENDEGLRIKLHFDFNDENERKLARIPWEYLYRPDTSQFLNLSRNTPIVRYIEAPQSNLAIPTVTRLRVLVIISSPDGVHELDLDTERATIEKTFSTQQDIDYEILEHPTPDRLQSKLSSEPFHVLHFMGHGVHNDDTGVGALVFEDEQRCAKLYDANQLGIILGDERHCLRLVVLNACDTAKSSGNNFSEPFGGVAASLVRRGLTAVVAMQFPISDRAAIVFSRRLYNCLAQGMAVDHASAEARKAIVSDDSASMEWATPVLFMRPMDGRIFSSDDAKKSQDSSHPLQHLTSDNGLTDEEPQSNAALDIAMIAGGIGILIACIFIVILTFT